MVSCTVHGILSCAPVGLLRVDRAGRDVVMAVVVVARDGDESQAQWANRVLRFRHGCFSIDMPGVVEG